MSSAGLRDRRLWPRYRPADRVAVALEASGWRVMGRLGDMSRSGLRVYRDWGIDSAAAACDVPVLVEWLVGDQLFKAEGVVIRVTAEFLAVRFVNLLDATVFQQLVWDSRACALQWLPGRVVVHGVLSPKIVTDVMAANHAKRLIDLRYVRQMDGAGLGIARLVLDRQGSLDGCHGDIRAALEQAGICSGCAGSCELAGRAVRSVAA